MILDKIDELLKEVQTLSAKNAEEVEQLRLKYLSKRGEITALMNDFRNVAADEKKTVGMKINELKQMATERINQLREECEMQESDEEALDLTRTPYPIKLGTRHPLTIVTNEIIDIRSGGRPPRVHPHELRCRPSCPRYAGHFLRIAASQ